MEHMVHAMVLPGALKRLHITGRFHHTDDRAVPLGTGTDGAELGFGIILADTAAVELGVGVLDRTRQCGGILIRHAQYLIGHPGRTLPPNARELAEFFDQLFQRGSSIQNMAFNPRKLDSVRHCHALMENVKRDFPRLSRAAECRYLSNVCNILFQIQDRQHEKIEKALWQEVKKYRRNVLLDPQARKKARLAAALSYSGYAMTRRVYEKTQWRGKK